MLVIVKEGIEYHLNDGSQTVEEYLAKSEALQAQNLSAEFLQQLQWQQIREKRDRLLSQTDWTQLKDCILTEAQQEQFAQYRSLLRNITTTTTDPEQVTWPEKP